MHTPHRRHCRRDRDAHDVLPPPSSDYNPYFFNFHNPDFYHQFPHQPNHYNPYFENPNLQFQHPNAIQLTPMEPLETIEAAVDRAWCQLVASAENVSVWKVSQSALFNLKAESWDLLGFHPHQVPILHHLTLLEGKINAFIHCFVAVLSITSLYDREVAICEDEGIENFEELKLGPLLRHPLVQEYFSSGDMTEVFKITGDDLIQYLKKFIVKLKGKSFHGNELLEFVAKRCKVSSWEKMGLRVQSLGKHVGYICVALRKEKASLSMCHKKGNNAGKKSQIRPLFSLDEKQIDGRTQQPASFSSAYTDFSGKNTQLNSPSSSENDVGDDYGENEFGKQTVFDNNKPKHYRLSLQNARTGKDSSCLYQFEAEKMVESRLSGEIDRSSPICVLKNNESEEPAGKKRKLENQTCSVKDKNYKGFDPSCCDDSIRTFITTWKDACFQLTATEVFEEMMRFYDLPAIRKRSFKKLLQLNPFMGLLNVAVLSIKNGNWDSIYDMFQSIDEQRLRNTQSQKCVEHECLEAGASGKDPIIEEDIVPETAPILTDIRISDMQYISKDHPNLHDSVLEERYSKYDPMICDAQEAMLVGRLGELIAFRHLKGKHGKKSVNWVNEENETGLPYDIVIEDEETGKEFVEVKSTRYENKKWFKVSSREWQFAVDKGDRYSIARVVLTKKKGARVTVYENPARLCQLRKLELALMVPQPRY